MNQDFILAFVLTPIVVVGMGYAALRLHDWNLRPRQNDTLAE